MEVSDLTIRLLLLFFPGLICSYIVDAFTEHPPRTPFVVLLQSLVFGIASYFIYWAILNLAGIFSTKSSPVSVVFLSALLHPEVTLDFKEIVYASGVSVLLGLVLTIASKYKIHYKLVHALKISSKFGELDVWGYTFNINRIEWATVRDHQHDLIYDGWVQAFSDDSKNAELLLRDVSVYRNLAGAYLYQVGAMYLSLRKDAIRIEFRSVPVARDLLREAGNDAARESQ
jgi:hypothetical protein